jgi:hypothetical protein
MVAIVVAGAGSAGGLTAFAVKKVRAANAVHAQASQSEPQAPAPRKESR